IRNRWPVGSLSASFKADAKSFARSFSVSASESEDSALLSSARRLNLGALAGRSKPGGSVGLSELAADSGVVGGFISTFVSHCGQRTANSCVGAVVSSTCNCAAHFGQVKTMIVDLLYLIKLKETGGRWGGVASMFSVSMRTKSSPDVKPFSESSRLF